MSTKKKRSHHNHIFMKKEKIKEGRIESALYGLSRLKIIKGYKSDIRLDGGEFVKIDLIVYPNWNRKIFLRKGNGFSLQESKEADEYGIYYLGVTDGMTMANIKTTIMEILLIEMEKREPKNNIAHK
jgi:hypothetical protein